MLTSRRVFLQAQQTLVRRFNSSKHQYVVSSKLPDIKIPKTNLHDFVWKNLEKWPERIAATCFETGSSYTYHQLYKKSVALTNFLKHSMNLKPQETIAIVAPNLLEYPVVLLGASQAGLRITPCNPSYTSDEIRRQLENASARVVFTTRELLPVVQNAISAIPKKIHIVEFSPNRSRNFTKGTISFEEITDQKHAAEATSLEWNEDVILPYSSGTTGLPKGVQLTHANIVSNLQQLGAPDFNLLEDIGGQHVVPAFLPFFHIYGLVLIMLHTLITGNRLITMPKFNSDNFIRVLRDYRPTVIMGVPLVALLVINNPNIKLDDMSSVKSFMSGAAPLGAADIERFHVKTEGKVTLTQGYGLTETSPLLSIQVKNLPNGIKIGGAGLIIPNTDAKIISIEDDGSMKPLAFHESGELLVRGPQVMKGYFNNPKATSDVIVDGWFKTGDIAHFDEDEHLFITDRLKELIKVKGFQVAPAELEEILRDYPGVEDAAVVGVPHEAFGEAPKAFLVMKKGLAIKEQQIKEYVADKVAKHKHLTGGVVFVGEIPKTASGKILRRELRKM